MSGYRGKDRTIAISIYGMSCLKNLMLPCLLHVHRNCLCLYRDPKNVERFAIAIQCMSIICVKNLKNLNNLFKKEESPAAAAKVEKDEKDSVKSEGGNEDSPNNEGGTRDAESGAAPPSVADSPIKSEAERLNPEEMEKMLQYMAKVFILQFPLYSGPKQASLR